MGLDWMDGYTTTAVTPRASLIRYMCQRQYDPSKHRAKGTVSKIDYFAVTAFELGKHWCRDE